MENKQKLTKVTKNFYLFGSSKVAKNLRFEARQMLAKLYDFRKSVAQGVENGVYESFIKNVRES